jgi:uncharacterized protein YdhG (YjbR/CyaY superfamily)
MTTAKANPIDAYLEGVRDDQRAALTKLRRAIRAAAPHAEEGTTYGLPAFLQDGPLVAFSASARHCSFFPMTGHTVSEFARELEGFDTSKGTIRFRPDKPLLAPLVRKIVKARLAENAGRRDARGGTRAAAKARRAK